MRLLLLLCLAAPLAAQPVDLSASVGGVAREYSGVLAPTVAPLVTARAAVAPGLPRGVRLTGTAAFGPGTSSRGDGRTLALGLGVEAPLSGGRDGVYLALGGAFVAFDNDAPTACSADYCFDEAVRVPSHTGLAVTAGVGARVPVGARVWVEPALSAAVWEAPLLGARLGVGWRLR